MSCNGCRVLRKGCSESCVLRPCLQWIATSEAQCHAIVFVAKFFGRADLMSFINRVNHSQRPALFRSLLFEACGRMINPVTGAAGLLVTGNWHLCEAASETVLRGGTLQPLPELALAAGKPKIGMTETMTETADDFYVCPEVGLASLSPFRRRNAYFSSPKECDDEVAACDLYLCLTPQSPDSGAGGDKRWRPGTPSVNSEGSVTTRCENNGPRSDPEPRLLNLFV